MKEAPSILIVEDDDDDFFFFQRAVRTLVLQNSLVRFRNGAEFVHFAEGRVAKDDHERPLLLFVDISMPVMNGFEVLQWIGASPYPRLFMPVVLSGSNREEDIVRAKTLGAVDYLVKPISTSNLVRIMTVWQSASNGASSHLPTAHAMPREESRARENR